MKNTMKIVAVCAALAAVAAIAGGIYLFLGQPQIYYTQIDNSKIQEIDSDDEMKYEYTLPAFSEDGDEKEVSFKTVRHLRAGAYLKLSLRPVRGVITWEEVEQKQLPEDAETKLSS